MVIKLHKDIRSLVQKHLDKFDLLCDVVFIVDIKVLRIDINPDHLDCDISDIYTFEDVDGYCKEWWTKTRYIKTTMTQRQYYQCLILQSYKCLDDLLKVGFSYDFNVEKRKHIKWYHLDHIQKIGLHANYPSYVSIWKSVNFDVNPEELMNLTKRLSNGVSNNTSQSDFRLIIQMNKTDITIRCDKVQ